MVSVSLLHRTGSYSSWNDEYSVDTLQVCLSASFKGYYDLMQYSKKDIWQFLKEEKALFQNAVSKEMHYVTDQVQNI